MFFKNDIDINWINLCQYHSCLNRYFEQQTIIFKMRNHLELDFSGRNFFLFLLFFGLNSFDGLHAQTCKEVSVELSAVVQENPPRITLHWLQNDGATQYIVYRKLKTGSSWGAVIGNLTGTTLLYVDTTVNAGVSYEYRVSKLANERPGYGYINAGIAVPAIESRGIIILVVDDSFVDSLATEIATLRSDLEGDGWKVVQHNVSRNATVPSVKALIVGTYNADKVNTKAVYLLGRIPVPYSGDIFPDGHPDHEGAWPADVYYGEMNGLWTDNSVNVTVANDERHRNVPEDGMFDQSLLPSDVELQVGRVDFANMPAFSASEQQLLKDYLDKAHAYKHKLFSATRRGVIDDNFGYFGSEAFASTGWKNFGPLCSPENVMANDYFTTTRDSSYLWSYGCGGGSYTSAGGIGNTNDFAASSLQSVFTMLFGSYFGDWDATNNFLRAPLAQGKTLTNAWSGRPHWMFHHMGLGENIGYSTRLTQNNSALYFPSYGARFVHIALMGDPSLRNDVVAPVANVVAQQIEEGALISWSGSGEQVVGYNVYMKSEASTDYVKVNDDLVLNLQYPYPCIDEEGLYTFMVRAVVLQQSPSGTYYNMSQGVTDTMWSDGVQELVANTSWETVGSDVTFTNLSVNASVFEWTFGDGQTSNEMNPTHDYADGFFNGYLVAWNDCSVDTFYFEINIFTGVKDITDDPSIHVSPNPTNGKVILHWDDHTTNDVGVKMYSLSGNLVFLKDVVSKDAVIDLTSIPVGVYVMHIVKDGVRSMKRIVIQ